MAENRCARCGVPTGTKARLCKEHHREDMRRHRQKRRWAAMQAGTILAAGIIEASAILESKYLRVALLEGAQRLIAQRLKKMKDNHSGRA
jgi:predicted nucleic acid-binding Zn ribbon protein